MLSPLFFAAVSMLRPPSEKVTMRPPRAASTAKTVSPKVKE